jgi:hypothetical protein
MCELMSTPTLLKLGLLTLLASACARTEPPVPSAAHAPPPAITPTATIAPTAAPQVAGGGSSSQAQPTALPPAMATATAAPAAPARHATALRVERLVVARGVEAREPQGADTVFAADEKRLFAFLEVDNPERAPGDVKVTFVAPDGEAQPPIELAVGDSPHWRTWAFTRRAHAPGTWKAIVRDERGHVLASTEFDVRG